VAAHIDRVGPPAESGEAGGSHFDRSAGTADGLNTYAPRTPAGRPESLMYRHMPGRHPGSRPARGRGGVRGPHDITIRRAHLEQTRLASLMRDERNGSDKLSQGSSCRTTSKSSHFACWARTARYGTIPIPGIHMVNAQSSDARGCGAVEGVGKAVVRRVSDDKQGMTSPHQT